MTIVTVGIDLAKNVFAVHGVNAAGQPILVKPSVARAKLLELIASLPPCTIGMEACSGAHHWARQFAALGHTIKLIAAHHVTPYRITGRRGKNDAADAAAIVETMSRPAMRYVPPKTLDQQAVLTLHRMRQGYVEEHTALINRIRGLLSEFGHVLPIKCNNFSSQAAAFLEELPHYANVAIGDALSDLHRIHERVLEYDRHLGKITRNDANASRLKGLAGVGDKTASAVVAMVGNASEFKSSRQFAAWLGLVPRQYSSGGKTRLGRITKAGDSYLRTLLIMGARAVLNNAKNRTDPVSTWAVALAARRGYSKALVAIAAKNARMIWAALRQGEAFVMPQQAALAD